MYKIMIHIDTHTNDTWFYYQEEGKDYVANSLEEIRETVLTLIDVYGEDYIKIVKQETGDDMNGSVETFLYDSTDNYEELVNRPFINGVEIVGALSLAELGIQPVGNYATNERVDTLEETVNNIDFSPYATNARVDQVEYKVDNIDLTPYATNERVDQVEAKVDAIDLEPYATMDYLDEVVAGIDFSASNENITGVKTFSVLPRSTVMPVTEDELTNKSYVDHEVLGCATEEYVDEAIANAEMPVFTLPALGAVSQYTYMDESEAARFFNYCSEHRGEYIHVYIKCGTTAVSGIYSGQLPTEHLPGSNIAISKLYSNVSFYRSGVLLGATLNTYITITEDGYTQGDGYNRPGIELSGTGLGTTQFLSKTNTNYYSPTGDYNPATKKYVDDSVAGIEIPEVDLDGYATTEYVDNAIANIDIPESGEETTERRYIYLSGAYDMGTGYITSYPDFTAADRAVLTEYLNTYHKGNLQNLLPLTIINNRNKPSNSKSVAQAIYIQSVHEEFGTIYLEGIYFKPNGQQISGVFGDIHGVSLMLICSVTDGVYSVDRGGFRNEEIDGYLTKTNTETWTPTGDYNPATKKYVDDAVANIDIPDVDLTDYYNKAEVDKAISEVQLSGEVMAEMSVFSTDEQVIGTWTNGKPLYRKVLSTFEVMSENVNLVVPHGVTGIEKIWIDFGNSYYHRANDKRTLTLVQTFYTTTSSTDRTSAYADDTNVYLISTGGWNDAWEKVITIQYTKEADEPTELRYYPITQEAIDASIAAAIGSVLEGGY